MEREPIWSVSDRALFGALNLLIFLLTLTDRYRPPEKDPVENLYETGIFSVTLSFLIIEGVDFMGAMMKFADKWIAESEAKTRARAIKDLRELEASSKRREEKMSALIEELEKYQKEERARRETIAEMLQDAEGRQR